MKSKPVLTQYDKDEQEFIEVLPKEEKQAILVVLRNLNTRYTKPKKGEKK